MWQLARHNRDDQAKDHCHHIVGRQVWDRQCITRCDFEGNPVNDIGNRKARQQRDEADDQSNDDGLHQENLYNILSIQSRCFQRGDFPHFLADGHVHDIIDPKPGHDQYRERNSDSNKIPQRIGLLQRSVAALPGFRFITDIRTDDSSPYPGPIIVRDVGQHLRSIAFR